MVGRPIKEFIIFVQLTLFLRHNDHGFKRFQSLATVSIIIASQNIVQDFLKRGLAGGFESGAGCRIVRLAIVANGSKGLDAVFSLDVKHRGRGIPVQIELCVVALREFPQVDIAVFCVLGIAIQNGKAESLAGFEIKLFDIPVAVSSKVMQGYLGAIFRLAFGCPPEAECRGTSWPPSARGRRPWRYAQIRE